MVGDSLYVQVNSYQYTATFDGCVFTWAQRAFDLQASIPWFAAYP